MRDQAVRVALHIPAHIVARMAGVARPTVTIFELDPLAVRDESKRAKLCEVYAELRGLVERFEVAA